MKNIAEKYRKMSLSDISRREQELRKEIAKLKLEFKTNPPKDTNLLGKKRRELAILLTIKREKELLEVEKNKK